MSATSVKIIPGVVPVIELLSSDCKGNIADSIVVGSRTMQKAEPDHKRYWREMVGTYLRNEMDLCPELPPSTKFSLKFPSSYELYGGMRDNGAWDFFLIGFKTDGTWEKFDSPANFVLHAKWLAYGHPANVCECRPCTNTKQGDISKRLTLRKAKIRHPRDASTSAKSSRVVNERRRKARIQEASLRRLDGAH